MLQNIYLNVLIPKSNLTYSTGILISLLVQQAPDRDRIKSIEIKIILIKKTMLKLSVLKKPKKYKNILKVKKN